MARLNHSGTNTQLATLSDKRQHPTHQVNEERTRKTIENSI